MTEGPSLSERLLRFAIETPAEGFSEDLLDWAERRLTDTVGAVIGALRDGEGVAEWRLTSRQESGGPCSVVAGGARRYDAAAAVRAHGMLAHATEFDDVHAGAVVHPGCVVVPAALAAGQRQGSSGREILEAICVGYEVMIRLGMLAAGQVQVHGFHPTSVFGVFGALAADARLSGADLDVAVGAAGVAGSMASGLMAYLDDGSETKPVHAGWAGAAALHALELGAAGATGPRTVLESEFGVLRSFAGVESGWEAAAEDLGDTWHALDVTTKPFPACSCVHAAVEAWRRLRDRLGDELTPERVDRVTALVPSWYVSMVCEPAAAKVAPRTAYAARFSLPFCVASMAVDGRLDHGSFRAGALADREILELAGRIGYEVRETDRLFDSWPGGLSVRLRDGSVHEEYVADNPGSVRSPLTEEQVLDKFRRSTEGCLPTERQEELLVALREFRHAASADAVGDLIAQVSHEERGVVDG